VLASPYEEAVAAATDPAAWSVTLASEVDVGGVAVTCVGATATSDAAGIPTGEASFACLADVQTAGTVVIRATGMPADPTFVAQSALVSLMSMASTFTPPA